MNPVSTLRYPRRAFVSWCLGALAMGTRLPSIGRHLSSRLASRSRRYRDLTSPVIVPSEVIAEPWSSWRFEARVPRRDPAAGDLLLEGILLRTGARQQVQAFCLLCPHEICHLEYRIDTSRVELEAGATPDHPLFVCPCHFSVFDPLSDGARISGPAYRGLYRFKLQLEQDTVRITQVEEEVLTLIDIVRPEEEAWTLVDTVSRSPGGTMKKAILLFVLLVVAMAASLVSDTAAAPQLAGVVDVAAVPAASVAEGGQQKLYVLSSGGNNITVVDVATNEIIGSIEVGDRPHGIAAPASQDVLYVATEFDNGLTVIDPVKDVVVKRYHVFGDRPNEIDVTSDGRFIYAPLFGAGVYEVFDTVEEKIVARIPTDGTPHNAVVSPDDRFVYLSPMDRGRATAEQMERRGLPSTENNKVYVVDTRTHTVVATIPTGDAPRPIAVNPDGKQLYVNIDGLDGFLVLDLEQRKQVARVEYELTPDERAVPSRSHGLVVTPDGKEVWSADVNRGLVFVYDVTQNPPRQIAKLDNAGDPYWMAVTPDGRTVYVASAPEDTVTAFDVATKTRVAVIHLPEGTAPKRMLVLTVPDEAAVGGGN